MLSSPVGDPFSSVSRSKYTRQGKNQIDRIEFNFTRDNYNVLIKTLRDKLKEPGRYSHNRPVLPPHQAASGSRERDWIDVVLSTDSRTVTFRIQRNNLYLVGYQMACGQWLEFGSDGQSSPHLIPGSWFLGFTGNYIDLERVGQRRIEGTQVSRNTVIAAVNELATTNDRNYRARDLTLIILVLCEATRFDEFSGRIVNVMPRGSTSSVRIELTDERLFRSWGDLSGRMLGADRRLPDQSNETPFFPLPINCPLRSVINSGADAATYIGLLLGRLDTERSSHLTKINDGAYAPRGQPMMELFAFRIVDFSGTLSGNITVTDGLGQQTIFVGQQSVRPGDTLNLSLLDRAISFWETITIQFNLESGKTGGGFHDTKTWDIFQTDNPYSDSTRAPAGRASRCLAKYSCPRSSANVGDNSGTIFTDWKIFSEAWQVMWEVKIVTGDGYNPMNVYGSVKVSYTYCGCYYETMLFSRSSNPGANVIIYEGGCVPLTRNATGVPLDVNVDVDLDLWDYIHVFPDRCLVKGRGTVVFGNQQATNKHPGHYLLKFVGSGQPNLDGGNSCPEVTVTPFYCYVSQA